MHIPDGYLSPSTCVVMYAAAAPFWMRALQRIRGWLKGRNLPLVALFAAASFIIMMFNIPLPGGTTGHATGAVLAAIVLGPWPAVLAVSVALIIQALFFGDGGILAIGANCFNMAIVMPLAGYGLYRLISRSAPLTSPRRPIAAAVAAYVGLNVSALLTALEFGIQPLLFKAPDGAPLYAPYGLGIAIPAMMIGHLLVAGVVEAVLTGLVIGYLQRAHREILEPAYAAAEAAVAASAAAEAAAVEAAAGEAPGTARKRRPLWVLWAGLGLLALLTPLGLLASGTAWGEWGAEELRRLGLGFIPAGMERLGRIWNAPIPDYAVPFLGERVGYIVSAVLGIALIVGVFWLLGYLVDLPGRRSKTEN